MFLAYTVMKPKKGENTEWTAQSKAKLIYRVNILGYATFRKGHNC